MLKILRITADAPTLLLLNGQCAGECGETPLYLPVGDGALLIQAFPMESGKLPVAAKITLSENGAQLIGPDALTLYLFRDSQLHAQIAYEAFPRETPAIPYVLARLSLGGDFSASVYFDRTFNFALERGGKVVLCGTFHHAIDSARIERRANTVLLRAEHSAGTELIVLSLAGEGRLLLHRETVSLSAGERLLEYTCPLSGGVFAHERFGIREETVLSRTLFRRDGELLPALFTAVREDAEEFALSLIHPSLRREASYADIRAFFGDFCAVYPTDVPNTVGLCYEAGRQVYTVRMLRAGIKDEQIANIEESEE